MKKKLLVCILAAGLLTGCGKIPTLSNGEEAVVEFKDGSMISVDELYKDMKDSYALQVLLNNVDTKILETEYKDKLDDVDKYIKGYETSIKANYVDENGNFDENALNQALSYYGYSDIDALLKEQRISYMNDLATTDYVKSTLTDKEVKEYYNKNVYGDMHAVHILVKPEDTTDAKQKEAKEKAEKIIEAIKKDIKSGTKAADAFAKYEKDESVTYQDLDYFNDGDMVSEFWNECTSLKTGSYSTTPVKTSYGYHVVLKLDEKEKKELKDIEDEVKEKMAEKKIAEDSTLSTTAMIELRKKYGVEFHDDDLKEQYNKYMNYLINKK